MSAGYVLSRRLLREDADQRKHSLGEQFNGLRYVIRHGIPWRAIPNDRPTRRAGCQGARHRARSRQGAGGQEGLRASSQALDRQAIICLGYASILADLRLTAFVCIMLQATHRGSRGAFIALLGAKPIDTSHAESGAIVQEHTADHGFDIVFDTVGGAVLFQKRVLLRCLHDTQNSPVRSAIHLSINC